MHKVQENNQRVIALGGSTKRQYRLRSAAMRAVILGTFKIIAEKKRFCGLTDCQACWKHCEAVFEGVCVCYSVTSRRGKGDAAYRKVMQKVIVIHSRLHAPNGEGWRTGK